MGVVPTSLAQLACSSPCLHAPASAHPPQGSPELNPAGVPYGFFHLPLPGVPRRLAAGYPLLLDVRLSAQRAAQALDYLSRGSYLSAALTKCVCFACCYTCVRVCVRVWTGTTRVAGSACELSLPACPPFPRPTPLASSLPFPQPYSRSLEATLVFYSADAAVFGVWSASFTWQDSGVIHATARLLGLPAISYGEALSRLDVKAFQRRLLPDLALLLLIACYCLLAGWDAYHTLAEQAALRRERRRLKEKWEQIHEGREKGLGLAAGWQDSDSARGESAAGMGTGTGGASAFVVAAAQMLARTADGKAEGASSGLLPPPPDRTPPPRSTQQLVLAAGGPQAVAEAVEAAAEGAQAWGRDPTASTPAASAPPAGRQHQQGARGGILHGGLPAAAANHDMDTDGRRHRRHSRWGSRSLAAAAGPNAKANGSGGGSRRGTSGAADRGVHYRPAMSVLWLCYEAVVCGLMAAALGVFFTYAIRLSVKDDFTAGWVVVVGGGWWVVVVGGGVKEVGGELVVSWVAGVQGGRGAAARVCGASGQCVSDAYHTRAIHRPS